MGADPEPPEPPEPPELSEPTGPPRVAEPPELSEPTGPLRVAETPGLPRDLALRRALRFVADVTVASGAAQMIEPRLVMKDIATGGDALSRHLFATVGMFMVVTGGALHRVIAGEPPDRRLLSWLAGGKIGAAAAVGLAVRRGLFARRALLVAGFDLLSGLGCLAYARASARSAG